LIIFITVTSALGKVTEKLHLKHSSHPLDIAQNPLQKGFTRGTSNSHVAVIITELIAESKDENSPLVIGFLDAQKAFDVLGHDSVIRKLYLAGIVGGKWNIINKWYKDLISCVKWIWFHLSYSFPCLHSFLELTAWLVIHGH
jgi:hypothetical protein